MDCNEVLEQLAEYLDEEARQELCAVINQHLARCTNCQIQVDSLRKTIVLYQNDRPIQMPAHLSARLEAVLAREYRNAPAAD